MGSVVPLRTLFEKKITILPEYLFWAMLQLMTNTLNIHNGWISISPMHLLKTMTQIRITKHYLIDQ